MDFFRQVAEQVRDVYGKLTFSQKISFVLLVALVVAMLVMFTSWGSQADYVRVTASPLGAARGEVISALEAGGIRYRFVGGTLEVVETQYHEAMAILADHGVVPGDALDLHMEDVSKDDGFVRTSVDKWHQRILVVQEYLGKVISHMEGIRSATVVLSTPREDDYIAGEEKGTAAVTVFLENGVDRLSQEQVLGIAALVSGGVRSIPRSNVSIVDNRLRAYGVRGEGDAAGTDDVGDRHELVMKTERRIAESVERMLSFYDPVRALVKVEMDFKRIESTVQEVDEEKVVPKKTTSVVEEDSSTLPESPGAVATPNVPVPEVGAGGSNTKHRMEDKTNEFDYYKKVTTMVEAPGDITDLSVSVLVSREQVIEQIKALEEGVDDKTAAGRVDQELQSVRDVVMKGLGISDQAKISVKAVTFSKPEIPEEPVAASGLTAFWEGYGAATVLGVLSLTALFLLWRMVKRPVEVVAPSKQARDEENLLMGMEGADLKAKRAERLEKEVESMIRKSPRDAASLISRWAQMEG
jgi:flagellar M-ring protein FliF